MKVLARLGRRELIWPEGWPIPKVGDLVRLPNGTGSVVRIVDWWPDGDDDDSEPYVYLVAGKPDS